MKVMSSTQDKRLYIVLPVSHWVSVTDPSCLIMQLTERGAIDANIFV